MLYIFIHFKILLIFSSAKDNQVTLWCSVVWLAVTSVADVLQKAVSTDRHEQVIDCMLSHSLSKSWSTHACEATQPSTALSASWPSGSLTTLTGLSDRTKRLLGYVSPRKLVSPGVSRLPVIRRAQWFHWNYDLSASQSLLTLPSSALS